ALNPRSAVLPTAAAAPATPVAARVSTQVPAENPDLPAGPTAAPPTAVVAAAGPTLAVPTEALSPTPTASPVPLPAQVALTGFRHEYQKFNNCGPASLAVNLSYWGWQGSQDDTAPSLKPNQDDKNVSPIEIYDYLTRIGFDAYIRVNGDLATLKRFIAAGYPVLVEKGFWCQPGEGSRCSDWFGHYSVFSGYDDAQQFFILQDTFRGPNYKMSYTDVLENWRAFNYLYVVVFPAGAERDAEVSGLLGPAVDLNQNYREALARARQEAATLTGEAAAFAWFNAGTILHYQQDYAGAAAAFDQARQIGLPYRMLWYQFGPYRAYYYTSRFQDVVDLATYAIKSTPKPGLEEAFYWRGLAYEALGQPDRAVEDYRTALVQNPSDVQAQEALSRLGLTP
ncbi:MAG: C39 family peptidase, partial [Anaerolineales bacterium]|nr:C39 family peptidase [Anaerolineales bacterium]